MPCTYFETTDLQLSVLPASS